ncbi:endothelin-converting enzyme homolog isoform X2 [Phymastichus coffea]|uniref:endothelin-converting enzyme homolog isoform X2 n=1 Tax=Phymastichus coffea TaxID=108790 RepID=UPI00273B6DDA|nr:endothelin-converting enzyme homolog isoform X2 [Phymastichus coffea]
MKTGTNHQRVDSQSIYSINSDQKLVGVKSKRTFFKKCKKKKEFAYLLAFIISSLAVAVVVLSILYAKFTRGMDLCDNEDCLRIAASLKESMNTSIDPCDDFYKYVCERWPRAHPSLDLSQEHSWFREQTLRVTRRIKDLLLKNITDQSVPRAVQEAKILFDSCMDIESQNELGLTPLFDLLDELSLPQIPSLITKNTSDFIVQMAKVKRVLWSDVFFGTYIYADPEDTSKNIIVLDLPDRDSPFPNDSVLKKRLKLIRKKAYRYVEDSEESGDEYFLSVERNYMTEVLKQIISNGTTDQASCKTREPFSIVPEADLQETANKVFQLSHQLYNLMETYSNETIDDEDAIIEDSDYIFLDDLQKLTDEYVKSINESLTPKEFWRPFIEELLKDVGNFDPRKDKVLVGDLDYLKEIAIVLASSDEELLETAIWWTVVDFCVPYVSKELRKIWNTYVQDFIGTKADRSRSLYCSESVNELMGMAVAWMYVNSSFADDGLNHKVSEMIENIKSAFTNFVYNIEWMDQSTKLATLEKNRRMKSLIGYPYWLFEDGTLDEYYDGINMTEDTYFNNMVQVIRLSNLNTLYEMDTNETDYDDEGYWPLEPMEVNALHTFQENKIAIPIGILQFPFYGLGLEALNYGAIGTILGHELTHGFDNSGRRFDSLGNLKQWWSNETISKYTDKTTCFIEQYNDYYVPEVAAHIDGELTLGENIADNGGLREAYNAYQLWKKKHGNEPLLSGFGDLTHEQLFFLGYAHMWCESYTTIGLRWMLEDPHCPGHVRLTMVLRNSEDFSKTWKCPTGSKMNPKKKCQLW